jgi:hypothetical protein
MQYSKMNGREKIKRLQYKDMQDLWNEYYSDNKIMKGDGHVIHHIDENPLNNKKENLIKMTRSEHNILHKTGRLNPKTEEQKKQISIRQKGINNSFYGKKHSEGTKKHWSKIRYGKICSAETKEKISKIHKGKIVSEETRLKISIGHKGIKTWTGKHHSEETKKKISESRKRKNIIPWNKGLKGLKYAN